MADTYSDLSWRIAQFRQKYPNWSIACEIEQLYKDNETTPTHRVVIMARVKTFEGQLIAACHAQANATDMELCEAKAIDRCLSLVGIGVMHG